MERNEVLDVVASEVIKERSPMPLINPQRRLPPHLQRTSALLQPLPACKLFLHHHALRIIISHLAKWQNVLKLPWRLDWKA